MSKINTKYTPYITMNALSVYTIEDNYFIAISDDDGILQKLAEFSPERICRRVQGLELIQDKDLDQFININISQLEETLGNPHADIGSGFYIPAYITKDASLICFRLKNDIIFEVTERNILTNTIFNQIKN